MYILLFSSYFLFFFSSFLTLFSCFLLFFPLIYRPQELLSKLEKDLQTSYEETQEQKELQTTREDRNKDFLTAQRDAAVLELEVKENDFNSVISKNENILMIKDQRIATLEVNNKVFYMYKYAFCIFLCLFVFDVMYILLFICSFFLFLFSFTKSIFSHF